MTRCNSLSANIAGLTLSTFFACAASLPAQQLAEGYGETLTALPAGAGSVRTVPAGVVYFDGFDLRLVGQTTPLLTFPSYTFGSFTLPLGSTHVLFGESSTGDLWRVPVSPGQPPQQVGNLTFNYSAAAFDDDRVLISAKTGGFSSPDNDIWLLDLLTNQTQLVAQFPGASGPVAVDPNGDVYYATTGLTFPQPPGSIEIHRLLRADVENAILAGTVLTLANAQLVATGLDAAGDIAFDDDGDLFFTDYVNAVVGEIDDVQFATGTPAAGPTVAYGASGLGAASLQFVPETTTTPQVFEPFQPVGGRLLVYETDYASVSQLRDIGAARPSLTASVASPIPTGAFDLVTTGGPSNGVGVLAFAVGAPAGPLTLAVPGFEQPLLLDGALSTTPVLLTIPFDAAGSSTTTVQNPGFASVFDATAQTVGFSTQLQLGTSNALALQIGQ